MLVTPFQQPWVDALKPCPNHRGHLKHKDILQWAQALDCCYASEAKNPIIFHGTVSFLNIFGWGTRPLFVHATCVFEYEFRLLGNAHVFVWVCWFVFLDGYYSRVQAGCFERRPLVLFLFLWIKLFTCVRFKLSNVGGKLLFWYCRYIFVFFFCFSFFFFETVSLYSSGQPWTCDDHSASSLSQMLGWQAWVTKSCFEVIIIFFFGTKQCTMIQFWS